MIVKNEEQTLGRCLESIKDIVDEIVIVDTGSTDCTKEIAKQFNAKIYDFVWIDDFSAARNYSFSKATMDYILWLDADDVVLKEDATMLMQLKYSLMSDVDIVMMKYNVGFDKNGDVTMSFFRARLLKRSQNYFWNEPIHEYIQPYGKIINSDICITHKKINLSATDRNLKIFEKSLKSGKVLSPRSTFYYARELYYNKRYGDAITFFNNFLTCKAGWVEDKVSACYHLSLCYFLTKQYEKRLEILLKSFVFCSPRAEILCQIGSHFVVVQDYEKAIIWYDLATKLTKPSDCWGFILHDCWDFIPNMQLCLCYDKLGKKIEAKKYNDLAAKIKPNDASVLYNKNYFDKIKL